MVLTQACMTGRVSTRARAGPVADELSAPPRPWPDLPVDYRGWAAALTACLGLAPANHDYSVPLSSLVGMPRPLWVMTRPNRWRDGRRAGTARIVSVHRDAMMLLCAENPGDGASGTRLSGVRLNQVLAMLRYHWVSRGVSGRIPPKTAGARPHMPTADLGLARVSQNGDVSPPDRAKVQLQAFAAIRQLVGRLRRAIGSRLPSRKAGSVLPEMAAIACFFSDPALDWHRGSAASRIPQRRGGGDAEHGRIGPSVGGKHQADHRPNRRHFPLSARALHSAQGAQFDFNKWARTRAFTDKTTDQIGLADAAGLVIGSTISFPSGLDVADRPHFRAQIDPAHDELFISSPVIGRVSGLQIIQFSRKLLDPDGTFAGVVVLSLGSAELARFDEFGLGNGFVSILSADGTILAHGRRPPD